MQDVGELQPPQVPALRAGRDPAGRTPREQRCDREAELVDVLHEDGVLLLRYRRGTPIG